VFVVSIRNVLLVKPELLRHTRLSQDDVVGGGVQMSVLDAVSFAANMIRAQHRQSEDRSVCERQIPGRKYPVGLPSK
jgi:hypothetical protein